MVLWYWGFVVFLGIRAWGGRDLYAGAVSGGSVGAILLHEMETFPLSMVKYFPQPLLTVVLAYGVAVAGLGLAMGLDGNLPKETRRQVWAVWIWCGGWLLGVTALFLTQRIFYAAGWPTGMRYDFPGMLGGLVLLCVLMGAGVRLLDLQGGSRAARMVFRLGVLAVLTMMIVKNGYYAEMRAGARENAARTQAFTRHIEMLRDMAAACPAVPIVMESFSIYDSEPVLSISYFLRAYGVENPLMVRLHGVRADDYPAGSGDRSLAGMLESASHRGGWGNTVPLANADTLEKGCLSLFLSGTAETECENAGRIW